MAPRSQSPIAAATGDLPVGRAKRPLDPRLNKPFDLIDCQSAWSSPHEIYPRQSGRNRRRRWL